MQEQANIFVNKLERARKNHKAKPTPNALDGLFMKIGDMYMFQDRSVLLNGTCCNSDRVKEMIRAELKRREEDGRIIVQGRKDEAAKKQTKSHKSDGQANPY